MSIDSRLKKVEAAVGASGGFKLVLLPRGISDAEESKWIAETYPETHRITLVFWRGSRLTKRYGFTPQPQKTKHEGHLTLFGDSKS